MYRRADEFPTFRFMLYGGQTNNKHPNDNYKYSVLASVLYDNKSKKVVQ